MNTPNRCERCGGPMPPGVVLGGRCPRCLLQFGLESGTGDSGDPESTRPASEFAPKGQTGVARPAAIGRYRILRLIGEGGMGTVYEAEQEQPRRTVALKVIKPGLVTPELLRRFEQEAQALGRLQHPGIAQIYEAGTADAGQGPQPYFAMELIRGKTLRDYAEAHRLNTRERLEMVAKISEAVHHAHQRGLIHRDLKPANILVDETGQPKILDFGVARVTDSDAQATMNTDWGQLVGTLAYMSPEQVQADPLDLDTRSDVYALGVILYELLAGRMPYDIGKKLHEAIQTIREEDPARLSSINRTYRGDIETIAAKAMEKDKTRRYGSAAELAADIGRYLKNEPIVARPASASYQLRMFARRHTALVTGAAAVFVVLVGGVVASTWQAQEARRERDRAVEAEAKTGVERDRASAAERTATEQRDKAAAAERTATAAQQTATVDRDRALSAQQQATKAETQARQDRDKAVAAEQRANMEADATKAQRLVTIWQSLARESVRDSASRVDDDRAALLARQAMLFHARTPNQARYLVEFALQSAARREQFGQFGHFFPGRVSYSVAFSEDGTRMATADAGGVQMWNLSSPGTPPQVLLTATSVTVAFSPDGARLAAGTADGVRMWNLGNPGAPPVLLGGPQGNVFSVKFSPDSARLAAGSASSVGNDGALRVWDLRNPSVAPLVLFQAPQQAVRSLAFSPNGGRLAGHISDQANNKSVRVWDLTNPGAAPLVFQSESSLLGTITTHPDSLAFSPSGLSLASGGTNDRSVRVWDLSNPGAQPLLLQGHQGIVSSVAFSPDGLFLVSGSMDRTVRVWPTLPALPGRPTLPPILFFQSVDAAVNSVAFSADGKRLASGGADGVRIWDLALPPSIVLPALALGQRGGVHVAFSPDSANLATLNPDGVRIWDLRNPGSPPVALQGQTGPVNIRGSVTFSPDGARLASGSGDAVRIWDLRNPNAPPVLLSRATTLPNLDAGAPPIMGQVAFSHDGTYLAAARPDGARMWNLRNPDGPASRIPPGNSVSSVAFSSDGRLAIGSVTGVGLLGIAALNPAPLSPVGAVALQAGNTYSIAFSPDGALLASRSSDALRVWNMRALSAPPLVLIGVQGPLGNVVFSPDGTRLASGGDTVRIWDLRNPGAPPISIPGGGPVSSVAFSPDGTRLAVSGSPVKVWPLWSAAADDLCSRVWRNLSMAEWRSYVGEGIPYEQTCPALPPGTPDPLPIPQSGVGFFPPGTVVR